MNVNAPPEKSQLRSNPVFWIMWALPGATVFAGLATLGIALHSADRPLPPAYHWEGDRLDQDFALARNAAASGAGLHFEAPRAGGYCLATLSHAPADAAFLYLQLTHGSNADLDRTLRLQRVEAGKYGSECQAIPAGRWRISVEDDARTWSLRGTAGGHLEQVELRARDPGAPM
ncbi:MAG: FixH family protein [Pseudomonadota bacterium]